MTVWSVEQLTSTARKHMRLPRARSTPSSRHWMLHSDAGAAAVSSLGRDAPSKGAITIAPQYANPGVPSGVVGALKSSSLAAAPRPYNVVRNRPQHAVLEASGDRNEHVDLQQQAQPEGELSASAPAAGQPLKAVRLLGRGGKGVHTAPEDTASVLAPSTSGLAAQHQSSSEHSPPEARAKKVRPSKSQGSRGHTPPDDKDNQVLPDPAIPGLAASTRGLGAEFYSDEASVSNAVQASGPEAAMNQDLAATAPPALAGAPPKMLYRIPRPGSGPTQLSRKLSLQSDEALRQLGELDTRLTDIEQKVEQLQVLANGPSHSTPEGVGQIRTALAQLEADANKLESKGVDSIYTSELDSGQAAAKEAKKKLIRRLEKLFLVIDDLFHLLSSSPQSAAAA